MARRKGSKSLREVGYGSLENKFGVRFTKAEQKRLQNEVQRVNKRLQTYTKQMQQIRNSNKFSVDSRIPVEPLFQKKSTSLQRFRNKDEYNAYIRTIRRQGSDNYRAYRYNIVKENYKKAIRSVFSPQDASVLIKKVNKITDKKLHEAFISKKLGHTGYIYYDPDKSKYNEVLSQLGKIV